METASQAANSAVVRPQGLAGTVTVDSATPAGRAALDSALDISREAGWSIGGAPAQIRLTPAAAFDPWVGRPTVLRCDTAAEAARLDANAPDASAILGRLDVTRLEEARAAYVASETHWPSPPRR